MANSNRCVLPSDLIEKLLVLKCRRFLQPSCVMDEYKRVNLPPPFFLMFLHRNRNAKRGPEDKLMRKSEVYLHSVLLFERRREGDPTGFDPEASTHSDMASVFTTAALDMEGIIPQEVDHTCQTGHSLYLHQSHFG